MYMIIGLLFFSKATTILKMVASAATNCENKDILLLFCLSYLYNINMRINSHTHLDLCFKTHSLKFEWVVFISNLRYKKL